MAAPVAAYVAKAAVKRLPTRKIVVGIAIGGLLLGYTVASLFTTIIASQQCAEKGPDSGGYGPSEEALADIPENYLKLYVSAGEKYGIDWAIIAAIGSVETNHGRLKAPGVTSGQNSHGCCAGPMQFHNNYGRGGGTWGAYGVDGNGDGKKNIYDPRDAIPAAGNYLKASDGAKSVDKAIFAYNHAGWYVAQVKRKAEQYRGAAASAGGVPDVEDSEPTAEPAAGGGERAKIIQGPGVGTHTLGNWQSDNAIDIGIPMGTPLVAVVDGRIDKTGGQAGTAGRFAGFSLTLSGDGNSYFYTHLKELKVKAGQLVKKGDVIGLSGAANGVEHLHLGVRDGKPDQALADAVLGGGTLVASAPKCSGAAGGGDLGVGQGNGQDVLRNKRITVYAGGQQDLRAGKIDPRVTGLLLALAEDHKITVTSLKSGHSINTAGGNRSNHADGRAFDIGAVDGVSCTNVARSSPCGELAREIAQLEGKARPEEVIFCFDPGSGSNSFAAADHCDHIHVGYGAARA